MLMLNRIHQVPSFAAMQRDMNQLFNAFMSSAGSSHASSASPAMNVWEDESGYFIEAELPGYRMSDLEVSVLGDEVTIKGQREPRSEGEQPAYLRRERRIGHSSFTRSFTLPHAVQADRVEASLTDGVLLVSLPKTPETQPRKIAVKSGR